MADVTGEEPGKESGKELGKRLRRRKLESLETGLDSVQRLSRDLAEASVTLSDREARFLVDTYYQMQENRKRGRAQERALSESAEPHRVITWFGDQADVLEGQIERALDGYSKGHLVGNWLRGTRGNDYKDGVFGVGPVLAAGMQAAIDISLCPTVGHIWQFAGIAGDGQKVWERGERRPWNARLKTLCWKFSDVQVKFSNDERCYYGHLYRERKEREVAKNEALAFKHVAEQRLARPKRSKEEGYHKQGILSPGHIDLRARRYAVKRFLSDLHVVWYWLAKGEPPPLPYPITYLHHAHLKPPLQAMPELVAAIKRQHAISRREDP